MALDFPNIDPVAFSVGSFGVRWYALAYMAGILLGWRYALWLVKGAKVGERPHREDIDNFIPYAVLGVVLGGRLGYVLFYQTSLYMSDPLSVFKVWEGGMSFHGGALGVILALFLFAWQNKIKLLKISDIVCATVPIGLFFGRIANFINGELYGRMTSYDLPWAVKFPRGEFLPRHPSQLYEAALEGLVLFVILFVLIRIVYIKSRPGIVTGAFLALYGVFRMIVELYREPDRHLGLYFEMVTMGQILSIPMVLLGCGVIIYALRQEAQARKGSLA